jgi:hypothetical protein
MACFKESRAAFMRALLPHLRLGEPPPALLRIVSRALATPQFLIAVFQNLVHVVSPFWKHDYAMNVAWSRRNRHLRAMFEFLALYTKILEQRLCLQRSIILFQRLFHSGRLALMASQSSVIAFFM